MAAVQQNITYRKELFAGDVIEIRSQVLEVADKRLRFRHEMRNIETGELCATCEITACISTSRRTSPASSRRPCAQAAEAMMAAGTP